jgi:hypothetical protein
MSSRRAAPLVALVVLTLLAAAVLLLDDTGSEAGGAEAAGAGSDQTRGSTTIQSLSREPGLEATRDDAESLSPQAIESLRLQSAPATELVTRTPPERPPVPEVPRVNAHPSGLGVRAQVFDARGEPQAGARVDLVVRSLDGRSWSGGVQTTGEDGWFDLRLVRTESTRDLGGMELHVHAPGLLPWRAMVVSSGGRDAVMLPPAEMLELELAFDDGQPVAGATLKVEADVPQDMFSAMSPFNGPALATTDDAGVALLPVVREHEAFSIQIEHPEHRSTELITVGPDDHFLQLTIARRMTLEVVLGGHAAEWMERGLAPDLRLVRRGLTSHAKAEWNIPAWLVDRVAQQPPGELRTWFTNVRDYGQDLALGDETLVPDVERGPGLVTLHARLPRPPAAPEDGRWLLQLEIVDDAGRLLRDAQRPWGELPLVQLEGRDGETTSVSIPGFVGSRAVTLAPPVTARFLDRLDGPEAEGLAPGVPGRLVVDDDTWLERSVSFHVDLSAIDPALHSGVTLELLKDELGFMRRVAIPHAVGIEPGTMGWTLAGRGVVTESGRADLAAGDEVNLVARPAELREQLSAVEPYGLVRGEVTLLSDDPWVELASVRYESLDEQARAIDSFDGKDGGPHIISGGRFVGAVSPGRYRLHATAQRVRDPESLVARWAEQGTSPSLAAVDLQNQPRDEIAVISTEVEVLVEDGDDHEVSLEVDTRNLGLVYVVGEIDGVALDEPGRLGAQFVLVMHDDDGERVLWRQLDRVPKGGVSIPLPAGLYHVAAYVLGQSGSDFTQTGPLEVPPLGGGSVTELTVDLRTDWGEGGPPDWRSAKELEPEQPAPSVYEGR